MSTSDSRFKPTFLHSTFPRLAAVNWQTHEHSRKKYADLNISVDSYQNARELCQNVGGMLPEPRDQEENDFLNSLKTHAFYLGLTKETPSRVALGLTDIKHEGTFTWDSDCGPVAWTFWRDGEPDDGTAQNCVMMLRNKDKNNMDRWKSAWCRGLVLNTTVCEKIGKFFNHHHRTTTNNNIILYCPLKANIQTYAIYLHI